jgi:hypothetical protein
MRTRGLSLAAAVLAVTGCQDLLVENLNDPDRFEAAADPVQMQELIVGGFDLYYDRINGTLGNGVPLFPAYSSEQGYARLDNLIFLDAAEPRVTYSNLESISVAGNIGPQNYYSVAGPSLMRTWSVGDDATRATDPALGDDALLILQDDSLGVETDLTPRLRAYGHLLKGLTLGQLANMYADATAIRGSEALPVTTPEQVAVIRPSPEVLTIALEEFEAAKALLVANPNIEYPAWADTLDPMLGVPGPGGTPAGGTDRWFGHVVNTGELIRFINTSAARFIILNARNPAERANLSYTRADGTPGTWQTVVDDYLMNGLTSDFRLGLQTGFRTSGLMDLQRAGNNSGFAIANRLVGMADTLGLLQAWTLLPVGDRQPLEIATPDRRITGNGTINTTVATAASSGYFAGRTVFPARGAYVRVMKLTNCCLNLGYWTGFYQWRRHAHEAGIADANLVAGTSATTNATNSGFIEMATVDENNLYLAEAYYHLGDLTQAAAYANITRTRNRAVPIQGSLPGLPAATVDGAPHSGTGPRDCVPKLPTTAILSNGDCGGLLTVIAYERMWELMGQDIVRGLFESRGFGLLPDDSWTELPLPAPEAVFVSLPLETRGGPGDPNAAVYAPVGIGWDGVP